MLQVYKYVCTFDWGHKGYDNDGGGDDDDDDDDDIDYLITV